MKSSVRPPPVLDPQPEDLHHLDALHGILGALNDPAAGIHQLKEYCARLPSLGNRILAAAEISRPGRDVMDLRFALAILGNRGLGEVLLQYLEDLTILKADLEEQRIAHVMQSPHARPSSRSPRAGCGGRGVG